MTVRKTRVKITWAISTVVATLAVVGFFLVNSGWSALAKTQDGGGCACAVSGGFSAYEGIILALAGLFMSGLLAGVLYLAVTLWRTRKVVRATLGGARGSQFVVFEGRHCDAFTFGYLKPKIAVCGHCVRVLEAAELRAMLAHEAQHVARRDPLKFLMLETLKWMFFFVPLLRTLTAMYRTAAELEADEKVENREALGSLLLRLTERLSSPAVASFASVISERIDRIVNPGWRMRLKLNVAHLLLLIILEGGALAVLGGGQPLQAQSEVICSKRALQTQCMQFDSASPAYYNQAL